MSGQRIEAGGLLTEERLRFAMRATRMRERFEADQWYAAPFIAIALALNAVWMAKVLQSLGVPGLPHIGPWADAAWLKTANAVAWSAMAALFIGERVTPGFRKNAERGDRALRDGSCDPDVPLDLRIAAAVLDSGRTGVAWACWMTFAAIEPFGAVPGLAASAFVGAGAIVLERMAPRIRSRIDGFKAARRG